MMLVWENLAWAVCARQESHLFCLGEYTLAFCARCTAWYGGMGISFLLLIVFKRLRHSSLPSGIVSSWSIVWLLLLGLDAITDLLGWRAATPGTRIITGFMAGTGIPLLLLPVAASFRDKHYPQPVIRIPEAILWWGVVLLHGIGLLLANKTAGLWAFILSSYFTLCSLLGLGFLMYTVSRMLLHLTANKTLLSSRIGTWIFSFIMLSVLWILHSVVSHILGRFVER